jgi:hypothetical protein
MNWDWRHALEQSASMLTSLLKFLSHGLELLIGKIQPHPNAAAAIIYLSIVVVVGLVVAATRSERHINKMMRHSWNRRAAKHAWTLALIVFFTNGVVHAVEQTKLLTAAASKMPFVEHLALKVDLFLGFLVLGFYVVDAINKGNFGRPKPALKYFGVVFATWTFEDLISMYWEHYGTNERIGQFLRWLLTLRGEIILIAILAFIGLAFFALRRPSVQDAVEDGLSAQM